MRSEGDALMQEAALIAGMAVVTFAVRYPPLALLGKIDLPPLLLRALRFVPPAVLTAIVVPAVLVRDDGSFDLTPDNAFLPAALVAGIVAWRVKNLLLTILVGMTIFFLWRWLFQL
jgi:branched-subunit amino acid transport protein